jgi:hypothetical protein
MCIIVHKPKGETIDLPTLKRCFEANPDGAGYMFLNKENNTVWGNKGFMTWNSLVQSLEDSGFVNKNQLTKKVAITLHFRRATHGGVTPGNCHPFPCDAQTENLKAQYWESDIGVAHNGVIAIPVRKSMSDSQEFIAKVLSQPGIKNNLDDEGVQNVLTMATRGSRLFILKADGSYILIGDWVEDQGCLFSNLSYQPPRPTMPQVHEPIQGSLYAQAQKRYPYSWTPKGR